MATSTSSTWGIDKDRRIDIKLLKYELYNVLKKRGKHSWPKYWQAMQQFFSAKSSLDELHTSIQDLLGIQHVYLHNAFLTAMLHNANTEKLPQECTPFLPLFISKDKPTEETCATTVGRKKSEPRPDLTSFDEDSPSLHENRGHNTPGPTTPVQVKKLPVKRIITPAALHCTRVPLTLKRKRSLVGSTPTSSSLISNSSDAYHSNLNMYHHHQYPMMMIESNQMGIRKLLEITRSKLMRSNCKLSGQKAAALASLLSKCTSRRQHLAKHKMHYVLLRNPASLSARPRPIQALARRAHLQTLPLLVRSSSTTNSSHASVGATNDVQGNVQGNPKGTCAAWIKTGAYEMGSILPMHPLPYQNNTMSSSPGTWTTSNHSSTSTNHHPSVPVSSNHRLRDALPSVESIFFTLKLGAARNDLSGSTKKAAQVLTKAVEEHVKHLIRACAASTDEATQDPTYHRSSVMSSRLGWKPHTLLPLAGGGGQVVKKQKSTLEKPLPSSSSSSPKRTTSLTKKQRAKNRHTKNTMSSPSSSSYHHHARASHQSILERSHVITPEHVVDMISRNGTQLLGASRIEFQERAELLLDNPI